MSWGPTLATVLSEMESTDPEAAAVAYDLYAAFPGIVEGTAWSARCPTCGSRVAADAVWDLRHVGLGLRCAKACVWRLRAAGTWTKPRLLNALGAPHETLKHWQAKELSEQRVQDKKERGELTNREAEYLAALEELPDSGTIPGTELP